MQKLIVIILEKTIHRFRSEWSIRVQTICLKQLRYGAIIRYLRLV